MAGKKPSRAERHAAGTFTPYSMTPAQEVMREELSTIGDLLHRDIGPASTNDPDVQRLALAIIDTKPGLALSMQQWNIVQAMIEQGILDGLRIGREGQAG